MKTEKESVTKSVNIRVMLKINLSKERCVRKSTSKPEVKYRSTANELNMNKIMCIKYPFFKI